MPTNLTEASSFDSVAAPAGDDIRNAASVQAPLQALTNRDKFVADRLTPLADTAALKAIANPADGLVRLVEQLGLYVFDGASVAAEALPFIVQPTTGTGRWLHALYALLGANPGLAAIGAGGAAANRILASVVPNRLVAALTAAQTANVAIPNTGVWTDALTLAVPNCVAGDILQVDAYAAVTTGGSGARIRVAVDDGGDQTTGREQLIAASQTEIGRSMPVLWTVTNAGSITLRLQGYSIASGSSVLGNASSASPRSGLRAMHFRP